MSFLNFTSCTSGFSFVYPLSPNAGLLEADYVDQQEELLAHLAPALTAFCLSSVALAIRGIYRCRYGVRRERLSPVPTTSNNFLETSGFSLIQYFNKKEELCADKIKENAQKKMSEFEFISLLKNNPPGFVHQEFTSLLEEVRTILLPIDDFGKDVDETLNKLLAKHLIEQINNCQSNKVFFGLVEIIKEQRGRWDLSNNEGKYKELRYALVKHFSLLEFQADNGKKAIQDLLLVLGTDREEIENSQKEISDNYSLFCGYRLELLSFIRENADKKQAVSFEVFFKALVEVAQELFSNKKSLKDRAGAIQEKWQEEIQSSFNKSLSYGGIDEWIFLLSVIQQFPFLYVDFKRFNQATAAQVISDDELKAKRAAGMLSLFELFSEGEKILTPFKNKDVYKELNYLNNGKTVKEKENKKFPPVKILRLLINRISQKKDPIIKKYFYLFFNNWVERELGTMQKGLLSLRNIEALIDYRELISDKRIVVDYGPIFSFIENFFQVFNIYMIGGSFIETINLEIFS